MSDDCYYEITVKDYGKEHVSFGVFKGENTARELGRKLIELMSVQEVNCSLYAAVPERSHEKAMAENRKKMFEQMTPSRTREECLKLLGLKKPKC